MITFPQPIIDLLTWMSYQFVLWSQQWNIFSFIMFFIFWIFSPYYFILRKKLGWKMGFFFTGCFAFSWLTIMDETYIIMNLPYFWVLLGGAYAFIYRWGSRLFFAYWSFKMARKYNLIGREIKFDKYSIPLIIMFVSFMIYEQSIFGAYNFRNTELLTIYPRWYAYLFNYILGWTLLTIQYLSMWRFRKQPSCDHNTRT